MAETKFYQEYSRYLLTRYPEKQKPSPNVKKMIQSFKNVQNVCHVFPSIVEVSAKSLLFAIKKQYKVTTKLISTFAESDLLFLQQIMRFF